MIDTALIHCMDESADKSWPLTDVAGLPLVERTAMALKSAGFSAVIVNCGPNEVEVLQNHFATRSTDARLPQLTVRGPSDAENPLPDLVLALDGQRVYHIDLMKHALGQRQTLIYHLSTGDSAGAAIVMGVDAFNLAAIDGGEASPLPAHVFAQPALSEENTAQATKLIFKSLIKPTDGWVSVHLNRPISLSISRLLVPFPISPNVVTLFTFVVGMLSGVFSAMGDWIWLALGGVFYQAASVLDGVDGEIARVKYLGSKMGQWMDTICDDLTNGIYMAGVTIGVYRSTDSELALWVGLTAVFLDVVTIALLYYQLIFRFKAGTLLDFQWDCISDEKQEKTLFERIQGILAPVVKRDFYALAFMFMALAGQAWLVIPLSFLALVAMLVTLVLQMRKWQGGEAQPT